MSAEPVTLSMSSRSGSRSFSPCRSTSNARIDLAVVAERREEPAIEFRERGVRDSRQVRSERHRGVAA